MPGRFLQRLVGAAVALAVVGSVALGGRSFAWCVPMQEVMARCCHASSKTQTDAPAVIRAQCCETRVLPTLPTASTESRETPVRAAVELDFVALAPFVLQLGALDPGAYVPALERSRGGPPIGVGLYDLHRAYLI